MTKEEKYRLLLKSKRALVKRKAKYGSVLDFTVYTYPEYEVNWHHKTIANYLNRFVKKEIKRLIVCTPPRHGKSELTSRRLPALLHGLYPNDEILLAAYNGSLASDMVVDVQRIMDSQRYREIFPTVAITADGAHSKYARTKTEHEILPYTDPETNILFPYRGSMRGAGVGGTFTGLGGNWVLIDDPIKNREDADSFAYREMLYKWYNSTIRTRLEKDASILITMTLWHEDDLVGRLTSLAKEDPNADQWVVVKLPAIKDSNDLEDDPRQLGESLWPSKYSAEEMIKTKASVGSREWSALYQQSPVTDGGNIVKDNWLKFYKEVPKKFDYMIQSWDFAVKDNANSDFTVGQVWGMIGVDKYLLHQIRGRFDFPTACQKVVDLTTLYPDARKKLIEAKANGPAIIQMLRTKISGLVEVEPRGDKVARMHAVSPEFESGHVYLPDKSICPWIGDYLSELKSFPTGKNDDQVDSTTQAIDDLIKLGRSTQPRVRYL